ncbi:hypothetical protein [Natronobiforma cellulositropha]|uniref:hypothetical protein n=1 Tax=Natronobiforma cellulositropha TaxID=1679076 RepID=UPI0021D57FEA|nr:hypothetical protein [Natronobiforma cellulositropha]
MSKRERFWRIVCDHHAEMTFLFALVVALFALTLVGWVATEPGTEEYVIATFNIGILSVAFVLIGYFVWRCS